MNIELKAYESKINLTLLNDMIAFVLDTAEATYAQRAALYRRCPFLYQPNGSFQEKYQFLYLGELLERYEERFGMSIPDLRAITLALGLTKDFTTDEMFVGPQRPNFLKGVRQSANDDIYLNGALYLLDEGRDGMTERELKLTGMTYDSTEDLLFAVGLFQNTEQAFLHLKPQLLRLLGKERTIPVMGNMTALNWVITWLVPMLKTTRGKDMALFRAICSLGTAYVKPGDKSHGTLLEHGYTALEIAYMNMLVVLNHANPDGLRTDSITTEKIVINLFHKILSHEDDFTPAVYDQLSQIFRMYETFKIRCGGKERLLQTLEDVHIQNADTFIWFSKLADIQHQVFQGFDIMDTKWDALASALDAKPYRALFEFCLNPDMSQEEIQIRLDRYQVLTGKNYTDFYWENWGPWFGLLVDKNIFDLWDLFQNSLDNSGHVIKSEMLSHIWKYAHKIQSEQAYQFFEQFFHDYGMEGLEQFFRYKFTDLFEALTTGKTYSKGPFNLNLHRDFLDEDEHRRVLHWLEEYIFTYRTDDYLNLITAVLQDDFAPGLFTPEEQRKLFGLVAERKELTPYTLNGLKRRYLTEAEQKADEEAQEAARRDTERREQEALTQSIREDYGESADGSIASAIQFLEKHKYYSAKKAISCRILREHLDELLEAKDYELDSQDVLWFFSICNRLMEDQAMSFTEAQNYISKVKECTEHDTDD